MPQFKFSPPQQSLQGSIPQNSQLRAQTFSDKLRQFRDTAGRAIAPLAGMNFDDQAAQEAQGISKAMIPFSGPAASKKLISTGISSETPNMSSLGSYFVDTEGKIIKSQQPHLPTLIRAGLLSDTPRLPGESDITPTLRETGLIRVRTDPSRLIVEAGTNPTDKQWSTLADGAMNHPKQKVDYELYRYGDGMFRSDNSDKFLDDLDKFYK